MARHGTLWLAGWLLAVVLWGAAAWGQIGAAGPEVAVEGILETDGAHAGAVVRMAVRVDLGGDQWHVNGHEPLEPYLIPTALTVEPPAGFAVLDVAYPEAEHLNVGGGEEPLAAYGRRFVIGLRLEIDAAVEPGEYVLEGSLRYQACDDTRCLMPQNLAIRLPLTVVPAGQLLTAQHAELFESLEFAGTQETVEAPSEAEAPVEAPAETPAETANWRDLIESGGFRIAGSASGYLNVEDFLAFIDRVESGAGLGETGALADRGLWFVLLFVLGGGVLLNLTPCVLPLIPINLAIIGAGAKAGSRTRGFLLGGAYGLGIALAYGALGLVVILGVSSTFGSLNATFWFNGLIAVVFVALGLAMFDVFLIDLTRFQARLGVKKKEGGSFLLAYAMGTVAALLAGACVAPVIISTIVYAQNQYAKGVTAALLLPFVLGAGMALPWPFAGAGLSFLPKPGKWMERVKYVFGVLILGFAAYYGYLSYSLFSDRYLVDPAAVKLSAQTMDEEGWGSSLSAGLAEAQRTGKPVIIDFWATWCKNCLTMNKTTFKDASVRDRLDGSVKIKFQAEDPSDPDTSAVMEHFGVIGLPTYVVLLPPTR